MRNDKWYAKSYRRNLIDMHIEEWDDSFLSKLDPVQYVELLKRAKVQTAMVYSQSHVGLCNWPTQNGRMHRGLKWNDFLGEIIKLLHEAGMSVVVYFSLIYDNWAYEHDHTWRIVNEYGCNSREKSEKLLFSGERYGVCCPNNKGYRDYVEKQIKELCGKYEYEGMFFDMTFWPGVCYCPSCKDRFRKETGMEIPTVIDWTDRSWLLFQKSRERWLTEFANLITSIAKAEKPGVTVEHQFSTAPANWRFGVGEGIGRASDYAGGDLYGGISQQSFICKLYNSLTENEPFEYMTSRCDPNLKFHTTTKSKDYLEQHTFVALAHNGAFLLIDAIDPTGVIQPGLYDTMGEIFSESMKYESFLGGEFCSDVAIYYSLSSKMCYEVNGKNIEDGTSNSNQPHLEAALCALETLKRRHIPVSVIGRKNLQKLKNNSVLVLPDVYMIDDVEATAIRKFVESGGRVYASGHTSHKLLDEVFGRQLLGETVENFTYMRPEEKGMFLMPGTDAGTPLTVDGKQFTAKAVHEENVMAYVALPYTDPSDNTKFASIHSNPPGTNTRYPALIYRNFGKGKVIWAAAPIEAVPPEINRNVFSKIIEVLEEGEFCFKSDAPAAVEVVMFHQPENKRYVVNLVNGQEVLPPVPVHNITVSVRLNDKQAVDARLMPAGTVLPFEMDGEYAVVHVPRLDIFHMFVLNYK